VKPNISLTALFFLCWTTNIMTTSDDFLNHRGHPDSELFSMAVAVFCTALLSLDPFMSKPPYKVRLRVPGGYNLNVLEGCGWGFLILAVGGIAIFVVGLWDATWALAMLPGLVIGAVGIAILRCRVLEAAPHTLAPGGAKPPGANSS
jgi:hypothetical protein